METEVQRVDLRTSPVGMFMLSWWTTYDVQWVDLDQLEELANFSGLDRSNSPLLDFCSKHHFMLDEERRLIPTLDGSSDKLRFRLTVRKSNEYRTPRYLRAEDIDAVMFFAKWRRSYQNKYAPLIILKEMARSCGIDWGDGDDIPDYLINVKLVVDDKVLEITKFQEEGEPPMYRLGYER